MDFREGQRFVVLQDIGAQCFVHSAPMMSEFSTVTLRAGEVLVVSFVTPRAEGPLVSVRPHRYEALEAEFVASELRRNSEYRGYHLVVARKDVAEHCKLLVET
jgi:hypothetical protein